MFLSKKHMKAFHSEIHINLPSFVGGMLVVFQCKALFNTPRLALCPLPCMCQHLPLVGAFSFHCANFHFSVPHILSPMCIQESSLCQLSCSGINKGKKLLHLKSRQSLAFISHQAEPTKSGLKLKRSWGLSSLSTTPGRMLMHLSRLLWRI
ncbi:hypothetical protein BOTBODRAFT_530095 [Botryobasidium botryosum FD-172 SS1]|uniref:Uncharacterized protein n=1 Tax=Botryobasidium botryosum (strain FD-172 SS1) TaxID=930990 RepID=A0A067MBZ5_BOTB1|nr:hypothetical protein BOTBODRAFT_530095 [Botryobasidium botryosum FD-172 SS1]